jgi:hypothetical protein
VRQSRVHQSEGNRPEGLLYVRVTLAATPLTITVQELVSSYRFTSEGNSDYYSFSSSNNKSSSHHPIKQLPFPGHVKPRSLSPAGTARSFPPLSQAIKKKYPHTNIPVDIPHPHMCEARNAIDISHLSSICGHPTCEESKVAGDSSEMQA